MAEKDNILDKIDEKIPGCLTRLREDVKNINNQNSGRQLGYIEAVEILKELEETMGIKREHAEITGKYAELVKWMKYIEKNAKYTTKKTFDECLKVVVDLKKTFDKSKRMQSYLKNPDNPDRKTTWTSIDGKLKTLAKRKPVTGWHSFDNIQYEDKLVEASVKKYVTELEKWRKDTRKSLDAKLPQPNMDGLMGLMPGDLWQPLFDALCAIGTEANWVYRGRFQ